MLKVLLTGWDFMRILRLGIGIFIGIKAIQNREMISGLFSAFFLFQAITNTGCCGANGCEVPDTRTDQHKIKDAEFEEIKTQ